MKAIRFLLPAEREMLEAAQYYASQVPGLGQDFLDAIESATADIVQDPRRWPVLRTGVRRRLVHRFPYGLLYRDDPEEVVVMAVMHLHRHPNYWLKRR